MKRKLKSLLWPTGLLILAGILCATYLLAQIRPGNTTAVTARTSAETNSIPDPAQEATDSALLVQAVNGGDYQTAMQILHDYGIAEDTLLAMAGRLSQTPRRATLSDPFLRGAVSMSLRGQVADVQGRVAAAQALGYGRPYWIARGLETNWMDRCDAELANSPLPPIAVLNPKLDDPNLIEFFKWYDRYAEQLHSVLLNGEDLSNYKVKSGYDRVNQQLSAFYKLIKARKPDAFVWLGVVKQDDHTDEQWLRAMTFDPDGLQIWNLRQFLSPFAETRQRYLGIVRADMPMMVAGFYGYKNELQQAGKRLSAAKKIADVGQRQLEKGAAIQNLGRIGTAVGNDLQREEQHLTALGYCGMGAHWLLLEAVTEKADVNQ